MTMPLRLSDILARGVVTEWYEAVALVRAVADRVLERPGAHSVPELYDIELAASGDVSVTGGLSIDEPVRRLGQLLQATLVQSEPPVQLRLLVSQATAPVSTFGSIREFQEALGYFERPDRQSVLQQLYSRAGVARATETLSVPTIDMIAPLAGPEPSSPAKARPRPRPRPRVWLAFAAAVLVVVSAAAYAQVLRQVVRQPALCCGAQGLRRHGKRRRRGDLFSHRTRRAGPPRASGTFGKRSTAIADSRAIDDPAGGSAACFATSSARQRCTLSGLRPGTGA